MIETLRAFHRSSAGLRTSVRRPISEGVAAKFFPVKVGTNLKDASWYWAKSPAYVESRALKTWRGAATSRQQDAVELARLAALKWDATCELGTVASSLSEMDLAIRANDQIEVTAMLLAEAAWFAPRFLGVCLFHRTWAGNVFVDFLATHPEAEGRIAGIGVGLLYQLCDASRRLQAGVLWGETAAKSKQFYERVFELEGVNDLLTVPLEKQDAFCRRMEAKWRAVR